MRLNGMNRLSICCQILLMYSVDVARQTMGPRGKFCSLINKIYIPKWQVKMKKEKE